MIKVKHVVVLAVILGILPFCDKNPTEQPPQGWRADAGLDQISQVGSYAILDGSGSTPGKGGEIVQYDWKEDKNNPVEFIYLTSDMDFPIVTLGLTEAGSYRFSLVVNDGIEDSAPDSVEVAVSPSEPSAFEDVSLEIHVRYALTKPTELLTDAILLSLDSLHAESWLACLTSLNGLGKCTNLEHLGIGHHQIVDLTPLTNLKKLEFLNLTQNRYISDISPLAGLIQLRYLDLNSNEEITDISALSNLTLLTYLNLNYAPISDISAVKNMQDLEELWLSDSPLGDISPLSELTKLSFLWLSRCEIAIITPITNLTNLRLLYLKRNYISDISALAGLTQLERLYLSDNQIQDISPLENLTSLPFLILSSNQIKDISVLENLTGLNLLSLSGNQVLDIFPLVQNTGLDSGDVVFLHNNPLSDQSINEYIPALRARGVDVLWP